MIPENSPGHAANSDQNAQLLAQKDAVLLSTKHYLHARLTRWVIRTLIGAIMCTVLANQFTWGKWVLMLWLPFAILSLTTLLINNRKMQRMASKIEASVAALPPIHPPER